MVTNTNATNIWQPDILGFPAATFYAVLAATIVVAVAVAVVSAIWISAKKNKSPYSWLLKLLVPFSLQ